MSYIGFRKDRKDLGYEALVDTQCGIKLVEMTDPTISKLTAIILDDNKSVLLVFSGVVPVLGNSNSILYRVLRAWLLAFLGYHFMNKFFPEREIIKPIPLEEPVADTVPAIPRGGIFGRLLRDRAFKVAIALACFSFCLDMFMEEIIALLSSDKFMQTYAAGELPEGLSIRVQTVVEELDLLDMKEKMRELMLEKHLSRDQKIYLLKIKLDAIINGDYPNKNLALTMLLLGILAAIVLTGPYGIMVFLAALYQMWKEGKISTAVYKQVKKQAMKKLLVT